MPDTTISIYTDRDQPDPSGGVGVTAEAVYVTPEYLDLKGKPAQNNKRRVEFRLEGGDPAARITGLRYSNMSYRRGAISGNWYVPVGCPAEWQNPWAPYPDGAWHFAGLEDSDRTLLLDIVKNDSVYVYVVEWTDSQGKKYVCDPKVRNG